MKIQTGLVIIGIIIIFAGLVFHFQGDGVIGPESSFMYSNTDWTFYGIDIMIIGSITLGIGLVLQLRKKN